MSRMRIALITRRFWPLVGGGEIVVANLASELKELGCEPKILTAQWETSWPAEVVHREIPVFRLPNPRYRGWGTFRYMVGLSRWLRRNQAELDGVIVSMLKHSAYAAIRSLKDVDVPILLRAEGGGETGDCRWHETGRFGSRIRQVCMQAPLTVAPSPTIVDELLDAGFSKDRVRFIANGVQVFSPASRDEKRAARLALAEVNSDLTVSMDNQVVVYTGRLDQKKGLFELVRSWPVVRERVPNARLWLIGDGPARERLFRTISDLDLRGLVVMPGLFDDMSGVLAAADAFVLPSYEEGMSMALLEAMMAGLPSIATDIAGNRQIVKDQQTGLLVPRKNVPALAQGIIQVLTDEDFSAKLALQAREFALSGYSSRCMAESHLDALRSI